MKRFTLLLILAYLTPYGVAQETPLYETITDNVPKIGITTEAYLGDRMLEQRTGDYRECIIPKQSYSKNYATHVWRIKASQPLCKDSADNEFYAANYHIIEACEDDNYEYQVNCPNQQNQVLLVENNCTTLTIPNFQRCATSNLTHQHPL